MLRVIIFILIAFLLQNSDAGQRCPVDNEMLSEDQLFPDNFAKREILSLTVRCPNSGCSEKMELRHLEVGIVKLIDDVEKWYPVQRIPVVIYNYYALLKKIYFLNYYSGMSFMFGDHGVKGDLPQ